MGIYNITDEQKAILAGEHQQELPQSLNCFPGPVAEALSQVLTINDCSKKIKSIFYRNRFTLIIAQQKSGSSALGNIVGEIFKKHGHKGRGVAQSMFSNDDHNLRPNALKRQQNLIYYNSVIHILDLKVAS